MLDLGVLLTAERIKQHHRALLMAQRGQYTSIGDFGGEEFSRDIIQRVNNIKDSRLRKMARAIPPFDAKGIRPAWSFFMAVFAGRHVFPDANHRTALTLFAKCVAHEFGKMVYINAGPGGRLTKASKKMRDEYRRAHGQYYELADLINPKHPYRQLYAKHEGDLRILDFKEFAALIRREMARIDSVLRRPQPRDISDAEEISLQNVRDKMERMLHVLGDRAAPEKPWFVT